MLFFKHFTTVIFASLLVATAVMAAPTKGDKPESITPGKIYQGKANKTEPKAGNAVRGPCTHVLHRHLLTQISRCRLPDDTQ